MNAFCLLFQASVAKLRKPVKTTAGHDSGVSPPATPYTHATNTSMVACVISNHMDIQLQYSLVEPPPGMLGMINRLRREYRL